jgi:hypothetical protein
MRAISGLRPGDVVEEGNHKPAADRQTFQREVGAAGAKPILLLGTAKGRLNSCG